MCGKNLWDEIYTDIATSVKYKALKVGDGQFTLSSTTPQASGAAQLFLLAGDVSTGASTSDNGVWSGHSKTVTASGGYVTIGYREQYGVSPTDYKTQLEKGATATDYEPYNMHSTTITLPSTVYGGSVDLETGILTVNGEYLKLNTANLGGSDSWPSWINCGIRDMVGGGLNSKLQGALSSITTSVYANTSSTNDILFLSATEVGKTKTELIAMAMDVDFYIPLATPITIQLTPSQIELLEGVNNVWAEMKENSVVIDNAQQSLSYQPQNIVGQLRQEIEAKPDSFAQLSDTSFSNLANGQIPKWNSTSQKWENANESGGGGASSLAELSDTNISSPADGQILKWDGTSSKWVNAAEYSYTLPTASASTKGGIKVGDNLSMNGEVLSAKLPQWEKIWNYNSGATFSMPSGKTDIMLVIMVSIPVDNRIMSNVYPVEYPFSAALVCSFDLDGTVLGGGTLAINVSTANTVTITNTSQLPSQNVDFEIWVR